MDSRTLIILLAFICSVSFGQTKSVLKTPSNNRITENLVFGTGKTIRVEAGGTIDITGATTVGFPSGTGTVTNFSATDSTGITWNVLNPTTTPTLSLSLTSAAVGLSNVENTAISTWAGSVNLNTAGTITTGTWNATPIIDTYISSAATWNAKQPAGNYITALTGDATASGPGSATITLANTSVTPGSYTVASITVDSKGRITSASNGPSLSGTNTGDITITDTDTIDFGLTGQALTGSVITQMSITSDVSGIKLSGDSATPGNSKYWGTNGSGTKGFYDLPSGGSGSPGGSNTNVQFNNSGSFSGDSSFNWVSASKQLQVQDYSDLSHIKATYFNGSGSIQMIDFYDNMGSPTSVIHTQTWDSVPFGDETWSHVWPRANGYISKTSDSAGRIDLAGSGVFGALPIGSISGLGTGIATALAINTGSAGAPVLFDGALGTPSSGVGTNLTALNASNLSSGTVATARLGTGTANSTTYLRGDGTWATPAGGGATAPSQAVQDGPITTTSDAYADITGLSVTVTATAGQKFLVRAVLQVSSANYAAFLRLAQDGAVISEGASPGSRSPMHAWEYSTSSYRLTTRVMEYLVTVAGAGDVVFSAQWRSQLSGQTVYLNRTTADDNTSGVPRTVSTLIVTPY